MDRTQIARQFFAADRFATQVCGAEIIAVNEKETLVGLELTPSHTNAAGMVMGGVLFTLADFAFAVAANTEIAASGDDQPLWISLDSSIHYLSPVKGNRLTAKTECVKTGRTTCLFHIKIFDNTDRLVSTIETTGYRPSSK